MPIFRKNKSGAEKPPSDGPEQWAAQARAVDERVLREREAATEAERAETEAAQLRRASEVVGEIAVSSGGDEPSVPVAAAKAADLLEKPESRKEFFPIEVLSEEYLRHFAEGRGYLDGKFVRVGDTIFVSNNIATVHRDIFEFAQKAMKGHELKDIGEPVLEFVPKSSGLVDGGKYDAFFDTGDESSQVGAVGRFRIYGYSGTYGPAEQENRDRTVEIASQVLGERIKTVAGDPRRP